MFINFVTVASLYGYGPADIFTGAAGIVRGLPLQRLSQLHLLWPECTSHSHPGGHSEIILGEN